MKLNTWALLGLVATATLTTSPLVGAVAPCASTDGGTAAGYVDAHNEKRCLHGGPYVVWDATVAASAQAHANTCVFQHSSTSYGENLYTASSSAGITEDPAAVVTSWYSEEPDYDYATGGSSNGNVIGHFTQLVWTQTVRIGCGSCIQGNTITVVCQYDAGQLSGNAANLANVPALDSSQTAATCAVTTCTSPGTSPTTSPGTSPTTSPGTSPTTSPGTSPTTSPGTSPTTSPGTSPSPGATPSPGVSPAPSPAPAPETTFSDAAALQAYAYTTYGVPVNGNATTIADMNSASRASLVAAITATNVLVSNDLVEHYVLVDRTTAYSVAQPAATTSVTTATMSISTWGTSSVTSAVMAVLPGNTASFTTLGLTAPTTETTDANLLIVIDRLDSAGGIVSQEPMTFTVFVSGATALTVYSYHGSNTTATEISLDGGSVTGTETFTVTVTQTSTFTAYASTTTTTTTASSSESDDNLYALLSLLVLIPIVGSIVYMVMQKRKPKPVPPAFVDVYEVYEVPAYE